jgi:hypothetical protein
MQVGQFSLGRGVAAFNLDSLFLKNLSHRTLRRISGQNANAAEYQLGEMSAITGSVITKWLTFANNPLELGEGFTAKWLKSEQYNLNSSKYFQIPEPEWQRRAKERLDESSAVLKAKMLDQTVDGTSPLPGNERWSGDGMATVNYSTPDFNGEPQIDLTVGSSGLDGGLLKGI